MNKNKNRIFIALTVVAAFVSVLTFYFAFFSVKPKKKRGLTAGMPAVSFTVGLQDSKPVELSSFFYKNTIILTFTGKDLRSEKLKKLLIEGFDKIKNAESKIIWFDLNEQSGWFVLTRPPYFENSHKYRFSKATLPPIYLNKDYPVIYLIDKEAVIKMIYRGYSPTAVDDVAAALSKK